MKKRQDVPKLRLDRETLRRLTEPPPEVLGAAAGGAQCSKPASSCMDPT